MIKIQMYIFVNNFKIYIEPFIHLVFTTSFIIDKSSLITQYPLRGVLADRGLTDKEH
jgi:hypothetical protein